MAHDPCGVMLFTHQNKIPKTKVTCLLSSGLAECQVGWIPKKYLDFGAWRFTGLWRWHVGPALELDYAKPPSRLSIRRCRKVCNPGRCVIMLHKAPPTIHREHTRDIDFRRPGLAKTRAIAARIRFGR